MSVDGPIANPPIDMELANEQLNHLEHLKGQSLTNKLKDALIREHLKNQVIV